MTDDRPAWQARALDPPKPTPDADDDAVAASSRPPVPPYPFIMGVVGGVCLGLGANVSVALRNGSPVWSGLGGLAAGVAVAGGITLAAMLKGEVFAGSHGAPIAWLRGKVTIDRVVVHGATVWLGNLVGALLPIWLLIAGGQYAITKYGIGETAISLASAQCSSPFSAVLIRAVFGGALMALALWLVSGTERPADKFFASLLPALGITAGALPHVIISSHIVLLGVASSWVGAVAEAPGNVTLGAFFGRCLAPATLGNIIGAALALAALHWITHIRPRLAERTRPRRPTRKRTLRPTRQPSDGPQTDAAAESRPRRRPTRRSRRTRSEPERPDAGE